MLKLTMIGRLGKDAEVRDVNGTKVIKFSLAHSERFNDRSGNKQERTTWVECSYWRDEGRTGVAQYLTKGKEVYVVGTPSARGYISNKDNSPQGSLELRVLNLELLGGRDDGQPPAANGKDVYGRAVQPAGAYDATLNAGADDLPF